MSYSSKYLTWPQVCDLVDALQKRVKELEEREQIRNAKPAPNPVHECRPTSCANEWTSYRINGISFTSSHIHNWRPYNELWNYEVQPQPSYVVKCSCGATALAITETKIKEITNIKTYESH